MVTVNVVVGTRPLYATRLRSVKQAAIYARISLDRGRRR